MAAETKQINNGFLSFISNGSNKHLRKISAGGDTDSSNEHLPILFDHKSNEQQSMRAFERSDRGEVIVKIDDGDFSGKKDAVNPINMNNDNNNNSSKIWRDASYDFWKEDDDDNRNNNVNNGGEMSLDMDLEMDELRTLPPVAESTMKVTTQTSKELNVSFQPSNAGFESATDAVRRRYKEASVDEEEGHRNQQQQRQSPPQQAQQCGRASGSGALGGEVVRCTSNGSFQRKSSLLRAKTRSRLMDPPDEPERRSGRVPTSGQLLLAKALDDGEDDPFWDDDLPDEYKKSSLSAVTVLEFVSLILIIAALVCSLSIPYLRNKNLWKLKLWRWEVLVLVLICGRLMSGWGIRIIVLFIERSFLLRKRVLYFVYGVRKPVRNCLWLGLVLIAWHFLFDKKVERETKSDKLGYVTKVLVCLLVGSLVWLVKTLMVKVLASSFHVSTYFDRIQESLFNQYVIETLSGKPLIEMRNAEEEIKLADEVKKLQNAGATIPPDLKASAFPSMMSGRVIGSGKLSRASSKKGDDQGITIDHLHRFNPKNVSAWNMKRLMNIARHGTLSTLDEQILGTTKEDETNSQIRSEFEAKTAAKKIFLNVARQGSKFIYLEDLMHFLVEDEALKTLSRFEGASDTKRISKSSLKNWVVNAFRERRALALTLNDNQTAVNTLHRAVNIIVALVILVISLLILGIATTKFLLLVSSQLVVAAFIFGNTCKIVFEAIIFLFVMHPFDVGDRCEIEGIQMVVEEMKILTTSFLRYDNTKSIYPNTVLATKCINNFFRSPDMGDAVEFCVHISTPADKIALIIQRIISYIESKEEHWYPAPMTIFKEVEELNRLKIAVWLTHRMNHQDMGERWSRRSLLVEEMVKIFRELDIQYRLLPIDINVPAMPPTPVNSTRLPSTWSETTS
ncbi:mechanosensitive ion channel protein 6-like [Corylus avellana]|uniref:mechanosensitive ion channel protein 6-like n=1 Tax=Corylus avellana TaxID=13451 RepID=UPI001E229661|nr:mechanosensitive ion channel protein 6-like [Corylus avellana]